MRVVFAGTPAFAVPSLRALSAAPSVTLAGVFTQPDRAAGRGRKVTAGAVKTFALQNNLPVFQPVSLTNADELKKLPPDLLVVVAYGLLLPPAVLKIPRLGCVNLHASLLPRWRGAAPVVRAIEAGDAVTGVTLMAMDDGLDTGAILAQKKIAVADTDTGGTLTDKLADLAAELLTDKLADLAGGALTPAAQNEREVCYAKKVTAADAVLDWRLPAAALARKVRAFNPRPAARVDIGGVTLKVFAAIAGDGDGDGDPGVVVAAGKDGITVATADGVLTLTELQKPGGRPMPAAALLNGMDIRAGMTFAAAADG